MTLPSFCDVIDKLSDDGVDKVVLVYVVHELRSGFPDALDRAENVDPLRRDNLK